jgi:preprotein translocase subunit SecB
MDTNKQPGIVIENVFLKELSFIRKNNIPQKPELTMNFEYNIFISPAKDRLNYELTCEIQDEKELFHVRCTMIGIFSVIAGNENMDLADFARINAPALIFPYVRETIASTSLKAGIPPVIIPPINLNTVKIDKNREKRE